MYFVFEKMRHFFCMICLLCLAVGAAADEISAAKYYVRPPECVDKSAAHHFQIWCDEISKVLLQKIEDSPIVILDENALFSVRVACMDMQDGVLLVAKIGEIETENVIKTIRHEASKENMREEIDSFTEEIISFMENGFTEKSGCQVKDVLFGLEGVGVVFPLMGVGGQLQILWVYDHMKPEPEPKLAAIGITAGAAYYFYAFEGTKIDGLQINADLILLFLLSDSLEILNPRIYGKFGIILFHNMNSDPVKSLYMFHSNFGIQLGGAFDKDETVSLFFTPSLDLGYYWDNEKREMVTGFLCLNLGLTLYFKM
jgi:hypothetical protein